MVKIYAANIAEKDYIAGAEEIMSPNRLEKYRAIGNEEQKKQCAAVAWLLYYAGIAESKGEKGKPIADKGYISISHSGDWALLAVSDSPVGVDIEKYRALNEAAIAQKKFTLAERQSGEDFFQIWVKKESMLKKSGLGICELSRDTSEHSFLILPDFSGYAAALCTDETEYEIIKK